MRVAVCLTGYLRTFTVFAVHSSIETVRSSLHNATLFAVVGNDYGDNFKGMSGPIDEKRVSEARRRVRIQSWDVLGGGAGAWAGAGAGAEAGAVAGAGANQYTRLDKCNKRMRAYEIGEGKPFLWVVRLRPDGLYWPVPAWWLASLRTNTVYQSSNSGDVMWILPRRAVSSMVRAGSAPCCGALPTRFFLCGCDIVRTGEASASISKIGLAQTGRLGNRNNHSQRRRSHPTARGDIFKPGTGWGVTEGNLHLRPSAIASRAYVILEKKPWTAG